MDMMVDVFLLKFLKNVDLFAYKLDLLSGDYKKVGNKVAYRLRKKFGKHWVWADNRIITDYGVLTDKEIEDILKELWEENDTDFGGIKGINLDYEYKPLPYAISQFIAKGGFYEDSQREISKILQDKKVSNDIVIKRSCKIKGEIVGNEPAISLNIHSELVYAKTLKELVEQKGISYQDLEGLYVKDKDKDMRGEIIKIVGRLEEHRNRLINLATDEKRKRDIENASDDEMVFQVRVKDKIYDYISSHLIPVIRTEDTAKLKELGILDEGVSKKMFKNLHIDPKTRFELSEKIIEILEKKIGYVKFQRFNDKEFPKVFANAERDMNLKRLIKVGNGMVVEFKNLYKGLREYGLYKLIKKDIRLGVINFTNKPIDKFLRKLEGEMGYLGVSLSIKHLPYEEKKVIKSKLSEIIKGAKAETDIILAILPENPTYEKEEDDYIGFKSLTINRGIPSQVVLDDNIDNDYAVQNIVLGILGKTGNIPYVLGEPLTFTDLIIGIDIARKKKERSAGTINVASTLRIYTNNGEFVKYKIDTYSTEGEAIGKDVLERLLPLEEIKNKRVIIHRDGRIPAPEREALNELAREWEIEFYLVEVIKSGNPRVYRKSYKNFSPKFGDVFMLSKNEAIVISTYGRIPSGSTEQPIRIRTDDKLTIEEAITSVLSLTMLHHGSLKPPRLPVTIHHSDKIANLALRGIFPEEKEGNIQYWL